MKESSKKTQGVSYKVSIREETREPLAHSEVEGIFAAWISQNCS
jgi:hypothetical protein